MLISNKSKAEKLLGQTRGQHFKVCLDGSRKVVEQTCNGINDYCMRWIANQTDGVVPTPENLHPPDMVITEQVEDGMAYNVEVKRDARSRDTGNIFFETKAISEAIQFGSTIMFFWIDGLGSYLFCDTEKLFTWLQNQHQFYKANAGDGKVYGGKQNSGWAIPINVFVKGECPAVQVGPIAPLFCEVRKMWINKKYYPRMNDAAWNKLVEDFYNSPTTAKEKMVVDFAAKFWNDKDNSWSQVSQKVKDKLS
jgi:hypothetical protein